VKHPLIFVPASPYELQLDLDTHKALKHFLKYLPWFSCIMHETRQELRSVALSRSRSGNWHVTIKLSKPKPKIERIALQAILGSDLARELCNMERVYFKSKFPILFVERVTRRR
jgi:hypothetical protein